MSTLIGNKKQRKSRVWLTAGRHAGPSREGPAVTARAQAGTPAHGGGRSPHSGRSGESISPAVWRRRELT